MKNPMQVPSHIKKETTPGRNAKTSNKICKELTLLEEEVGGRSHHV
jgi:hypothetical protein